MTEYEQKESVVHMRFRLLKKCLPASFRDRHRDQWLWWKCWLKRFVTPPRLPQNLDGKVCLHLGCGPIVHPRFTNIDTIPFLHVHYVQSAERLERFRDGSVDLVYCSHCLEHVPHQKIHGVLVEWHRVLKVGGILRVSVPDFELILAIYNENGFAAESIQEVLMGGQDNAFNFHKTVFDRASLTSRLQNAGFTNVADWRPGTDEMTTFDDWSNRKARIRGKFYPISLNLQAEACKQ